jgi:hypothetical protein
MSSNQHSKTLPPRSVHQTFCDCLRFVIVLGSEAVTNSHIIAGFVIVLGSEAVAQMKGTVLSLRGH